MPPVPPVLPGHSGHRRRLPCEPGVWILHGGGMQREIAATARNWAPTPGRTLTSQAASLTNLRTRTFAWVAAAVVAMGVLTGLAHPAPASAASSVSTARTASSGDVTITRKARTSRSSRGGISVRTWANSATARRVARRESGGNCRAVSRGGTYRGKWQMNSAFWAHYGGRKFASSANRASCAEQDLVAYRGWVDRWWRPWSTF
jgi:hypothetical protein